MLPLCIGLFVVTLWRCMDALPLLEDTGPVLIKGGLISLVVLLVAALVGTVIYFLLFSWHDAVPPCQEQMIVCVNNMHGGSGSWRYFTHINDLIHGAEIARNGSWWGTPPFH